LPLPAEPSAPADPHAELGALVAEVSALSTAVARHTAATEAERRAAAETRADIARLVKVIGEDPDDSAGTEGSGMRRQLALLVREARARRDGEQRSQRADMATTGGAAAAGGAGLLGLIELARYLFTHWGPG